MILIADSGSTKTDWTFVDDGALVKRVSTQGINPVHQSREFILDEVLKAELLPQIREEQTRLHIYFYGAGCVGRWAEAVRSALAEVFPEASDIAVESDLLGAARAVCGRREGLAAILGTGANSCLYDGRKIVGNIPPLGYILGDEGSGAVLGRMFLNAIFKGALPAEMRDDYLSWAGLSYADVIEKVYRQPLANRFLANTSRYIYNHLANSELRGLVKENFRAFFSNNIARYGRQELPLGAVGSVAFVYRELLSEVATEEGYVLADVYKSPMEGLVKYHSEESKSQ
ncbi:MAG: ATPase [Bacteroidaceae bacterium]|nr:ATPase [Bacteroidaceae bacterium]